MIGDTGDQQSLALAWAHGNALHAGRALLSLSRARSPADPLGRADLASALDLFRRLRAEAWVDRAQRALAYP